MRALLVALLAALASGQALAATRKAKSDPAPASPAQPAATAKLGDFALGPLVAGSGSLADAKGKAAVIEAWGVNCPPCIASLPHLQQLSVKHKDKVLFFGAECQMSDKKSIEAAIKKAGVTYPIFSGMSNYAGGIPHAFVFDATGKLIFDGHPLSPEFTAAVEKAAATVKGGSAPTTPSKTKA